MYLQGTALGCLLFIGDANIFPKFASVSYHHLGSIWNIFVTDTSADLHLSPTHEAISLFCLDRSVKGGTGILTLSAAATCDTVVSADTVDSKSSFNYVVFCHTSTNSHTLHHCEA